MHGGPMIRFALPMAAAFCFIFSAKGAESADIDNEILRIKKELAQVRQERQKAREDAQKDKKEFAEYEQRVALRKASLAAETDSVKRVLRALKAETDSLAVLSSNLDVRKKQYEALQDRFRERLAVACGRFISNAKKYPPAISKQCLGALSFLLSDCTAKSMDNVEGLHRLAQIAQNMEEYSQTVQTGQENSPTSMLRGATLMLRIGTIFEAVVDEDGKAGAVWIGNDADGQPRWKELTDASMCATILKAITIRESRALPELIALPYLPAPSKETKR